MYGEYLTKGALEALGDFRLRGLVIGAVKYADDLVLPVREDTVLQGMIGSLIESGQWCGMEMSVETN